jgi:hypothetical protein
MFEASEPTYRGPERRRIARRTAADRRQSIRFEDDRRQSPGRRSEDLNQSMWRQHQF